MNLQKNWTSAKESSFFQLYARFILWLTTGGTVKKDTKSCNSNDCWKIKGVGILWNNIVGIVLSLLVGWMVFLLVVTFFEWVANILTGDYWQIPSKLESILWVVFLGGSFMYMYVNRIKKIASHTAQRLLILDEGVVSSGKKYEVLNREREGVTGETVNLFSFKTLREGSWWLPFGVELDSEKIDLQEQSSKMESATVTKTDDNVEVTALFGRNIRIAEDGARFSMLGEKNIKDLLNTSLQTALRDMIEAMDEDFLFTRSGTELQTILLSRTGQNLPFIDDYFKMRKKQLELTTSTPEELRIQIAQLDAKQIQLKNNIARIQNQLIKDDERYGIQTVRIFQLELDYRNEAARKALEGQWIQKQQAIADKIRVQSLTDRINEYLAAAKDKSEDFASARRAIQNLFKDRIETGVDATGNPTEADKVFAGLSLSGRSTK